MNEKQREQREWRQILTWETASYVAIVISSAIGIWASLRSDKPTPPAPPEKIIVEIERDHPRHTPRGWSPEAVEANREWAEQQAGFRVISKATGEVSTQDNTRANVRLWKLTSLNVAEPPPNGPQQTNDCSSWASAHAIEDTQSTRVTFDGGQWQRAFPPWLYASGRAKWASVIRSPMSALGEGCSVGMNARAAVEDGVVSWDEARTAGYEYSGTLADRWGVDGPPEELKSIAAKHKVGGCAQLLTAAEVRDAICNGYGVATGSDFTPDNFHAENGRIVADNAAPRLTWMRRWHHAMAIDGYDGSGPRPYYHIQNSHYPTSHPAPIDDSPACGFWVTEETVGYMAAQRDTYSLCGFGGFVEKESPVDLFSHPSEERIPNSSPSKTGVVP